MRSYKKELIKENMLLREENLRLSLELERAIQRINKVSNKCRTLHPVLYYRCDLNYGHSGCHQALELTW